MQSAGFWRADISAAREVFLDDVVLHRALKGRDVGPLFLGHGYVEGQQPRGGSVDRHGRVHLIQRDLIEQCAHIAQMRHGDAHLAHFAAREFMVAVIAGLGGQVEGDRKTGLAAREVVAVERVGGAGGGMTGIGAEEPGRFFLGRGHGGLLNQFGNFISLTHP
jgi:hypothetical protein